MSKPGFKLLRCLSVAVCYVPLWLCWISHRWSNKFSWWRVWLGGDVGGARTIFSNAIYERRRRSVMYILGFDTIPLAGMIAKL